MIPRLARVMEIAAVGWLQGGPCFDCYGGSRPAFGADVPQKECSATVHLWRSVEPPGVCGKARMQRDQLGSALLTLLCVAAVIAGVALVVRFLTRGGPGDLLAGVGGIGCGVWLLRFTRARSHAP